MSFTAFNGSKLEMASTTQLIINNDGLNELYAKVTGVQLFFASIMISI